MPWHFGYQGIGGLRAIVDAKSGKILKSVQDLQGNILGYVKAEEVIWKEDVYDAYGPIQKDVLILEGQGSLAEMLMNRHSWRGKRVDATGLIWMGTRYYNPATARFLSPDPYGHAGSIDLYSYANGNPVKYCDPDGRYANAVMEGTKQLGKNAFDFFAGDFRLLSEAIACRDTWSGQQLPVVDRVTRAIEGAGGLVTTLAMTFATRSPASGLAIRNSVKHGGHLAGKVISEVMHKADDAVIGGANLLKRNVAVGNGLPLQEMASVQQQVQQAAHRAGDLIGPGKVPVHGTKVHSAFKNEIEALGNPNLRAEVNYLNSNFYRNNIKGSVRLDAVHYGGNGQILAVYDLKTGSAILTQKRIQQILSHLPEESITPRFYQIKL